MNNKKLGNEFETQVCEMLASKGYWVHFIVPDIRGAQPFDIIAVKNGVAYAIDCKTCVADTFNISRLEENQIMAFEKWLRCGNENPVIVVEHDDVVVCIDYVTLKKLGKVKIGGKKNDEIQNNRNSICCSFGSYFD